MTIDEILACEIPAGKYSSVLRSIKNAIKTNNAYDDRMRVCFDNKHFESLCASFEVLYDLAKGEQHTSFIMVARLSEDWLLWKCTDCGMLVADAPYNAQKLTCPLCKWPRDPSTGDK